MFSLPLLLDYIIRPCSRRPRLFPDMWRRKHNRRRAVPSACPRLVIPSRPVAVRSVSRFVPRLVPRSALLACLVCLTALIISSAPHGSRCLPPPLASPHRLIGSPLSRIARLPVSSTSGAGRGRNRMAAYRYAADGGRRVGHRCGAAVACLPRMAAGAVGGVIGGGWDGWRALVACLSWGRWAGRLGHLSSPSHRLIPSTREGPSFSFRLTPSRLLFSVCLPWLVPPSPAGGCAGCGMACGGGREGLFACLLSCPCRSLTAFVRSLLYARCRFRRCAYLGRCGAFYGLF